MTILPPDANLDELPRKLARLRHERRWSYDDLAERTGLSRRTLIEIEQGRTIGTIATWHALSHAFDTPLDGLFSVLCEGHTPPGAAPGILGTA
ncbi:helix-turn-helix transcriptional regulator [Streptomyces sp. NPDC007818]|uniref:helix-turn-helix transcriptional regulator n=1 Tax=Streptomyces sp. NPDC007818 TaxID=3364780 RepID=UPI0036A66AD5